MHVRSKSGHNKYLSTPENLNASLLLRNFLDINFEAHANEQFIQNHSIFYLKIIFIHKSNKITLISIYLLMFFLFNDGKLKFTSNLTPFSSVPHLVLKETKHAQQYRLIIIESIITKALLWQMKILIS